MKRLLFPTLLIFTALGVGLHGRDLDRSSTAAVPSPTPDNVSSIADSLVTYAVKDFREHQPPTPLGFRKVRLGYLDGSDGQRSYRLCGEFLAVDKPGSKGSWVPFATIRTAPYEHRVGGSAVGHCGEKKMRWLKTANLSLRMKKKMAGKD